MPKYRDKLPEFEPPKKKLFTEHEQQVKMLYGRQTNVATTLESELLKEQCFEKRTEVSSTLTAGTITLEELQTSEKQQSEINTFLSYGLTTKDVEIYQELQQNGLEYLLKKYINHEPMVLKTRVQSIVDIVAKNQENKNYDKMTTKNYNQTPNGYPLEHPMHDIKKLEAEFNEDSHMVDINKIRRKARKKANRVNRETPQLNTVSLSNTKCSEHTKLDKTEIFDPFKPQPVIIKKNIPYTCAKQNFYTIKNGEIIKIHEEPDSKTDCSESIEITRRLTLEEIKQLSQFSNYEAGEPSNVVYIKNLPKKITIDNLKQIFQEYPADEYKLMSGKMHGQAFLTYSAVEIADKVLDGFNGVVINGKPIVLQYGRKHK